MLRAALIALALLITAAPAPASDRLDDLEQELDSLTEDIEDLREPVEEFELFDECMYLIGVSSQPGYVFGARARPALRFDLRGFGRPGHQFFAFPGEEPPSIECNEDAGEEESDD